MAPDRPVELPKQVTTINTVNTVIQRGVTVSPLNPPKALNGCPRLKPTGLTRLKPTFASRRSDSNDGSSNHVKNMGCPTSRW